MIMLRPGAIKFTVTRRPTCLKGTNTDLENNLNKLIAHSSQLSHQNSFWLVNFDAVITVMSSAWAKPINKIS